MGHHSETVAGTGRAGAEVQRTPTAAIIDSQLEDGRGGEQRGYDGGKKISGRKRHIAVDALGLLLVVVVHAAEIPDDEGARFVLDRIKPSYGPWSCRKSSLSGSAAMAAPPSA